MKKLVCVCLCLLLMTAGVFAANNDVMTVDLLLKSGLKKNQGQILSYSASLNDTDKMMLYSSHEKDTTLPFVLNLVVGLGIGSYVQGDTTGGTIALVGDVCSVAAVGAGYGMMIAATTAGSMDPNMNVIHPDSGMALGAGILTAAGFAAMLGFRIYECIRPFTYAKKYNQNLMNALYGVPTMAFVPVVQQEGELGMAVVAKVAF